MPGAEGTMDRTELGRAQAREQAEDVGRNRTGNPAMGEVIAVRFNRRDLLHGALAVTAIRRATVSGDPT